MNSISNLPISQFEALGFEKKDILGLPSLTLEALLSGKRSQLMSFNNVELANGPTVSNLAGRLGLNKQADGNYNLKIYTTQAVTPNAVEGTELTEEQITSLKSPENPILRVTVRDKAGFSKELLVQYDSYLNDFATRPLDAGPHQLNGQPLSERQRSDFALGKTVKTPDGEIRKDLNSLLGYKASFLILGAATATPASLVTAIGASVLAMRQLAKTLFPDAKRPYISYDDAGIVRDYVPMATALVSRLLSNTDSQITESQAGILSKLEQEIKELAEKHQK
jgi:hypothetical protein